MLSFLVQIQWVDERCETKYNEVPVMADNPDEAKRTVISQLAALCVRFIDAVQVV